MPADSGLPADAVVSTFHFSTESDPPDPASLVEIAAALGDCYNAFTAYLSPFYNQGAMKVTYYNLADPEPRVPLEELPLPITSVPGAGAYAMPPEVSVCCSFEGNQVSGEPQARKRGRVYLGPWGVFGATQLSAPPGAILSAIDTGFTSLLSDSDASLDWTWCVHSPSLLKGTTVPPLPPQPLASTFFPVVRGWIDNAWDTQRRRGIVATARNVFPGVG